ncbi:DUF5689 domain-containing protein [uncultured Alistipes sp.]|uniref:DUF5689 domain-containing protein n=1 Tax=uncultured Alistipes sp. TaxID=538949 RepID=UPI0025969991|nr:DUF5689 domain-containing protein [uncultured Alistipes sp.]
MSKHLFRLVFGAFFLVAATAFTGCSDDDDKSLTPKLTADPTALDFTDETATTQTVAITANCEWTVTASNLDWATISPMSGKGNGTISVTVSELPAGTNLREGKISFTLIHPEFGKWGQAESSVAVKQYGSGVTPPPTGDPIYANDFDKEQATEGSSGWPFADQFEGWKNQTGTGADNVTYVANSISVRANSASNGSYSKYKDDASGVNNMLFRAGAEFEIHKIALDPAQKNLCLTFGSYKSLYGAADNAFVTSEFHVYLSKDGENWAEIAYDRPVEADEHSNYGTWALATANFTLKEVPSELYIRFISDLSSAHRVDDVKLFEGIGGTEVDLGNVTPPTPGEAVVITIPEIIAKLTTSQVALDTNNDRYFEAVVVTDKEGGNFNGQNLQVMTPGATTAKNGITLYGSGKYTDPYDDGFTFVKGDKVKVTLKKGEARIVSYNGLYEVTGSKGADWVEIEKIGTETITPVVADPAKLAEYQGMVVTVKGVTAPATAADWTTNEAFGKHTFTTSAGNMTVFVQKAMPGLVGTQFVAGSTGDITGYASVNSNAAQVCPQRPEDVAAFMGEPSTDPAITKLDPTSLSFAATDNAKTVTVTAANADGCTIEAATDKSEQFTTSVNGMVVTVTPKENTTEQAITATLTIKLMKAGAAVDTKTVAISQAGKSVPGGSGYTRVNAVTAGKKYLIVAETGEKNYVFEAAQLAGGAGRPNGVEIAVSNSKIDSNTTNDAYAVTIEASGDGYVIKTADGKFVEYNGSSTTLKLSDTAGRIWIATAVQAKNTIKFTDKETMSASTVRCLLFQNTSAYQRFGGYAEQNADTSDYVTVALYELSE